MGFDAQNFGFGLLTGWVSAYGVYRARHAISRFLQSAEAGARSAQSFATNSADQRYINDLIAYAERIHLAGDVVRLSEVLVEPRFLPAQRPPGVDDELERDVYDLVPRIHDHPWLHAPYALDSLSIDELATGDRVLALVGTPGSGRTSALLAIAMYSLGQVSFKPPTDVVQQRLEAEEARLTEKERATKIQERLTIELRARERLADEKGVTFDADSPDAGSAATPLFRRIMPLYVHMGDVVLDSGEYGGEVDPAEPLVRAVQHRLGRIAAQSIPRSIYNRLGKGTALVLIDGYDDLPETARLPYLAWLKAFIEQYRQNFIIIAAPAIGYGALTRLGATPIFLRPFNDLDVSRLVERCAAAAPRLAKRRGRNHPPPADEVMQRARTANRGLAPFELLLKLWANFNEDTDLPGVEGWLRGWLKRLSADSETLLSQLAQIAVIQLDEGFITRQHLERLAISAGAAAETADAGDEAGTGKGEKKKADDSESGSAQGRLLGALRRAGILVRYRGDRYLFRHPQLAAYLASLTFRTAPETLTARALQPGWTQAIGYAALHSDIEAAVNARLSAPADVLYNHVCEAARWLAYADAGVAWRANLLRLLGNLMTAQSQYPHLRARAAAALVGTRERNITVIFRRAVRTTQSDVRLLSCLGMGASGDPDAIRDLHALLGDADERVQLAAAMALSALGAPDALDSMLVALTQGSEKQRQAVAMALAAMPEDGYPILYEAIDNEDMLVRRAAVFGMRRLKTAWAYIGIYRAFLEDEQWYVRSAAQIAFEESQFGRAMSLTTGSPPPESLTWLADWARGRGENIPTGEGAITVLLKALQEGDGAIRQQAADTLGVLGLAHTAKPLYTALRDRQEDVRTAAYRALAALELAMGRSLPSPV